MIPGIPDIIRHGLHGGIHIQLVTNLPIFNHKLSVYAVEMCIDCGDIKRSALLLQKAF